MPGFERVYRTEVIVLRRHDLGETDRILTLYTRSRGKVRAVAKGVRKPTSRKAGHVELFMCTDMLLAEGRTLDVVTQVEGVNAFLPLREDLTRTSYAAHIVELLDAFTEDHDENGALYDLLRNALGWITTTSDLQRTARFYELQLLDLSGYRPELFHCVICDRDIKPEDQFFSVPDGGVVCPTCEHSHQRGRSLTLRALKVLRYLQTRPFSVVEQLTLSSGVQAECERILYELLSYHLERRLKSAAFLERLRRETRSPGE